MPIDEAVKSAIEENKGFVVIMAGSDTDRPHIDKISEALNKYGLRHQVRICSAHKEPERLMTILRGYEAITGAKAYVAVAGGTDALSGTVSYHATSLVISCPPDTPNETCLTNPPMSSNLYVKRADNAARAVAQIFAHLNPEIKKKLEAERDGKITKLQEADAKLSTFPYQAAPKEAK